MYSTNQQPVICNNQITLGKVQISEQEEDQTYEVTVYGSKNYSCTTRSRPVFPACFWFYLTPPRQNYRVFLFYFPLYPHGDGQHRKQLKYQNYPFSFSSSLPLKVKYTAPILSSPPLKN